MFGYSELKFPNSPDPVSPADATCSHALLGMLLRRGASKGKMQKNECLSASFTLRRWLISSRWMTSFSLSLPWNADCMDVPCRFGDFAAGMRCRFGEGGDSLYFYDGGTERGR